MVQDIAMILSKFFFFFGRGDSMVATSRGTQGIVPMWAGQILKNFSVERT